MLKAGFKLCLTKRLIMCATVFTQIHWWVAKLEIHHKIEFYLRAFYTNKLLLVLATLRLITELPKDCQPLGSLCDWSTGRKDKQKLVRVDGAFLEYTYDLFATGCGNITLIKAFRYPSIYWSYCCKDVITFRIFAITFKYRIRSIKRWLG